MVFYAACCSNFVIHCCQYWTASTLKQIHNKYCNKWNPNQCAANKLSVSKSWQWYGSYLMAERSSSLLSLPEYTLTYILFLSPCFHLSVLRSFNPDHHTFKASHKPNFLAVFLSSFLPSLSDLWSCQHFKSYRQSPLECLRLVIPLSAGCLLVHKVWRQRSKDLSWEIYEKKITLFPNLPVYPAALLSCSCRVGVCLVVRYASHSTNYDPNCSLFSQCHCFEWGFVDNDDCLESLK